MKTTLAGCLFVLLAHIPAAAEEVLHPCGVLPEEFPQMIPPGDSSAVPELLPAACDMTSKFPPPGDQGQRGSCVGWATAYALKSQQEEYERAWGLSSSSHRFAPMWIYNQINHGADNGSRTSDAMNLLRSSGCDTMDMFTTTSDYLRQPDSASRSRALQYRILSWTPLGNDLLAIKARLFECKPVVFSMLVYPDFDRLSSSNPIYDSYAGTYRGSHALCLVGYDDSKRAFKLINSWGTDWGIGGYGWLSYDLVGPVAYNFLSSEDKPTTIPTSTLSGRLRDHSNNWRGHRFAQLTLASATIQNAQDPYYDGTYAITAFEKIVLQPSTTIKAGSEATFRIEPESLTSLSN